jgi:hypothetical protein
VLGYFVEMAQRHVAMVTKSTVAFGLGLGVSVTVTEKKGVDSMTSPSMRSQTTVLKFIVVPKVHASHRTV